MKTILQDGFVVALLAVPLMLQAQTNAAFELPPLETIGKRVAEKVQKDDNERAFKQRYGYVRSKVTEYLNAKGEIKKREEKVRTHTPKSAPVESSKKSADKTPQKENSNEEITLEGRGKAFEKSDFPLNDELLNRFEFTLVGREELNGRSALIIDFKPASKQPPERNIKDKFINKAAGRVWVDEEEYELVKADLHLTERVGVIGGLVGAVSKFNFNFDRERTAEGFWFVRTSNWHLEVREVFFRRIIDFHERKKDIKKVW